jgi:hypothetical protein
MVVEAGAPLVVVDGDALIVDGVAALAETEAAVDPVAAAVEPEAEALRLLLLAVAVTEMVAVAEVKKVKASADPIPANLNDLTPCCRN